MSNLALFLTIIAMGLVTFGQRLSFILLADRLVLPPVLRRGLKYVPTAVLSAIFIPDMFMPNGRFDLSLNNAYLIAGLVAAVAAWYSKNVLVTMVIGMAVLWGWAYVVG